MPKLLASLGVGGSGAAATVTFRASNSLTTDTSTYTHSALSLGPTTDTRIITIAVGGPTLRTVNSVTVDGVSATEVGHTDSGSNNVHMWRADPSASTTGDVVVTLSGNGGRCVVGVYSIANLSSTTPTDTASDDTLTTNALSDTINISAGGVCIGVAYTGGGNSRTTTWAGITENFDTLVELNTATGACDNFAAAQTGLTVSATFSGTSSEASLFAASFR